MAAPIPGTANLVAHFREACDRARADFGLPPGPPPADHIVESRLDLDGILKEKGRDAVQAQLRGIFNKAHGIFRHIPANDKDCMDSFRELAFWNAIRILAGFSKEDVANSPAMAAKAKHPEAVWEHGMEVRMPGSDEFVPAKQLLAHIRGLG